PYEFVSWECGYPMHVVGVENHRVHLRADRRLDGNFFYTDNYAVRETWTAPDGRWFTITANGIYKDVQARRIGGSLYEFSNHNSGQPIVITDSSRNVVSRDRGNVTSRYTIDLADGSFNFLGDQVNGPHP